MKHFAILALAWMSAWGASAAELSEHWSDLRSCGMDSVADAALSGWRARMHDVSQFAKTFKGFRRVCPRWRRMRRTGGGRRDDA